MKWNWATNAALVLVIIVISIVIKALGILPHISSGGYVEGLLK